MCHLSTFTRFAHTALCSHIYFLCSHHKQLNGDLKGITFVVLAVHEEVVLMSSSYSETRLLLCLWTVRHVTALYYVPPIRLCSDKIVSAFTTDFTFVKLTSQLFSSADEFLKDETRLLLLWVGSLLTLHALC